jgi:hypothetical protein
MPRRSRRLGYYRLAEACAVEPLGGQGTARTETGGSPWLGDPKLKWNRSSQFRELLRRSSQIAAHRRISARIADRGRLPRRYGIPASGHNRRSPASEMGLIAMQKVVGSNPISRFFANRLHRGGSAWARVCRINWNHPRISPTFRELIRISSRNRPDGRRSTLIGPTSPGFRAASQALQVGSTPRQCLA